MPTRENVQVPPLPRAATVRLRHGQITQAGVSRADALLVRGDDGLGLVLGSGDVGLAPAARAPTISMLDQQMSNSDLALVRCLGLRRGFPHHTRVAMMLCHVGLELVRVGVLGRLPIGGGGKGVEVVWEVLRVGMSHLPIGRKAGLGLV